MRWLIRRVTKKGRGAVAYEEDIHYGDVLTIGRGSDQAIFLPDLRVALQHARVTAKSGGKYKVESLILAGIRVNNQITHTAQAGGGAVIEIGTTRLQLLDPPTDFDAGVEVSVLDKAELSAEKAAKAKPTALNQTWLSRRRPSWIGFLAVALLFVTLPMLAHYLPGLRQNLAKLPGVPSQNSWQAGDLAAAHHYFGSDCTSCHEKAFRWVRDEACATCHSKTLAHADPRKFNVPELGEARCAHCHRDHNGAKGLIVSDQELCADCHHGLKARTQNASMLADVSDFGTDHPEFQINLPAWDDQGRFAPRRMSVASADLREDSGLKFPHDVHLAREGIQSPNGDKVLECASCHVAEAGGARMQPVNFETMCQECHRLDFDITEPNRQVPHGKLAEIVYMLDEFYAQRALEGGISEPSAPPSIIQRRRPGQALTRQEQIEALAWAREKARVVGERLFNGKACTVCHTVSAGTTPEEPWKVAPVRVSGAWFTKAQFTHADHAIPPCEQCHRARESKQSSDLLILGIDSCRACHGGEHASERVESTCISCHGYHEWDAQHLPNLQASAKAEEPDAP